MKVELTDLQLSSVCYIKVDAGVRYWEDTEVNGEDDIDFYESKGVGTPKIPCAVKVKAKLRQIAQLENEYRGTDYETRKNELYKEWFS